MININYSDILNIDALIFLIVTICACFVGSYTKDIIDTFTGKCLKMQLNKIIISSIFVSLLLFSFSDYVLSKIGFKPYIAVCVICGLLSFEITVKISTIDGLKGAIDDFICYRNTLKDKKNKDDKNR